MIEFPYVSGAITPVHLASAGVAMVIGLGTHELTHFVTGRYFGAPMNVDVLPRDEETSWWKALLLGTLVQIDIEEAIPRKQVAAIMLAPLVAATPGLWAWMSLLNLSAVSTGSLVVTSAYLVFALPSPTDIITAASYDPDRVAATGGVA